RVLASLVPTRRVTRLLDSLASLRKEQIGSVCRFEDVDRAAVDRNLIGDCNLVPAAAGFRYFPEYIGSRFLPIHGLLRVRRNEIIEIALGHRAPARVDRAVGCPDLIA